MISNVKKRIEALEVQAGAGGVNELIILQNGETLEDYCRDHPEVKFNPALPSLIVTIGNEYAVGSSSSQNSR